MNENNLKILKHCPHFYTIINFDYYSDDLVSGKLIDIYQKYIFTIDVNSEESIKKIEKLDNLMYKYINDYGFRNQIKQNIQSVKISKSGNILDSVVNAIINLFENYDEIKFTKVELTRWI